jgi:hypothetical protein
MARLRCAQLIDPTAYPYSIHLHEYQENNSMSLSKKTAAKKLFKGKNKKPPEKKWTYLAWRVIELSKTQERS